MCVRGACVRARAGARARVRVRVRVFFLYILLSMLHHPEVILHTIMCLAIRTCLWVGDAGSACALGFGHCIPFTMFILRLVFLSTCIFTFTTKVCHILLSSCLLIGQIPC